MPADCSIEHCTKQSKAKTLCSTHYNQQMPGRHKNIIATCDNCGRDCIKQARSKRYAGTYCTLKCRDDARHRGERCELPADHWARVYGTSCEWRPPKPQRPTFVGCACNECGRSFVTPNYGSPTLYCSMTCQRRVARRIRRAAEHNAPGSFTYSELVHQYLAQGKVCAYCAKPVVGMPDPEHVLPLSRGGRNDMTNLVAACRRCNTDKGDLTLTEWAADRQRRHLPAVHTCIDTGVAPYTHLVLREPTRPAWRHLNAA